MKFEEMKQTFEEEGYLETSTPELSPISLVNGISIDMQAAEEAGCSAECGRVGMDYHAFQHPESKAYRAVAECPSCHEAISF